MTESTKANSETSLYPRVERWMCKHFRCFRSDTNIGLKQSRVDVIGIRDIGGIYSGEIETLAIEVKRGTQPFATACGQAAGYQVYAHRVYLAEARSREFSPLELEIAGAMGLGLLAIGARQIKEVLSAPRREPLPILSKEVIAKLRLAKCQICESYFETGNARNDLYSNVSKENMRNAAKNERGLLFWLRGLSNRKKKLGIGRGKAGFTMEKRFLCPECVQMFFAQDSA